MTSYSLSNVLLPAVFISSAVFSTLTVPLALIKSEPVVVEIPPFFSGEIQPLFDGEHKDVAIPYIGFSIIVSVGAGIASVEVTRRWQAYRESHNESKELLPNLEQTSEAKEAGQDALKKPEYRPETSAIDLPTKAAVFSSQSLTPPSLMTEASFVADQASEQVVDATQPDLPQPTILDQIASSAISEELNLSSSPHENESVQIEASSIGDQEVVQALDFAFCKVLKSRHLYQTCRIKVPHLEQRLFAILFEGKYYSFLRVEETKEKVLEIMRKIGQGVQETVVTKIEKGYVIWIEVS